MGGRDLWKEAVHVGREDKVSARPAFRDVQKSSVPFVRCRADVCLQPMTNGGKFLTWLRDSLFMHAQKLKVRRDQEIPENRFKSNSNIWRINNIHDSTSTTIFCLPRNVHHIVPMMSLGLAQIASDPNSTSASVPFFAVRDIMTRIFLCLSHESLEVHCLQTFQPLPR